MEDFVTESIWTEDFDLITKPQNPPAQLRGQVDRGVDAHVLGAVVREALVGAERGLVEMLRGGPLHAQHQLDRAFVEKSESAGARIGLQIEVCGYVGHRIDQLGRANPV